jgi:hypothetical protein
MDVDGLVFCKKPFPDDDVISELKVRLFSIPNKRIKKTKEIKPTRRFNEYIRIT